MKSLVIIFSLVGLSLSSTCTDTKPEVNEDCLSVYMENNMCCYQRKQKSVLKNLSQIQDTITHSRISRQQEKMNGIHFLVQLI